MNKLTFAASAAALAFGALQNAHAASYEYVGSWHVGEGPQWDENPPVYSAQEAAALLYGGNPEDYAISTVSADPADINYLAYLDGWGDSQYLYNPQPQDWKYDAGNPGYADPGGGGTAYSAYVLDHSCTDRYYDPDAVCTDSFINYAFLIIRGGMPMSFMPLLLEGSARNRLDTLYQRRESTAGGTDSMALADGPIRLAAADTGTRTDAGAEAGAMVPAGHGFFLESRYADFQRSADADGNGLDGSGWQFTAGYDRRLGDSTLAGVALGYDNLKGDSLLAGNNAEGDIYSLSVYGRYAPGGWYADGALGYAYGDFDTNRDGHRGGTNSDQFFAELRVGTHRQLEFGVTASPYAGLRYTWNGIDGYRESGVDGYTYADHDSEAAYGLFGVRLDFGSHASGGWLIRPSLDATFSKRLTGGNDDLDYLDASSDPSSASVLDFDEQGAGLGARLELQRSRAYSLLLGFGLAHGSEGTTSKSAYIGATIPL